ncbi:hypothetical protein DL98DRAFT_535227 [Cadophora sp. DSE1049]|nr:hypothetical protein DL98DRAFT_535227 [Cadophora sp. DSE1049]
MATDINSLPLEVFTMIFLPLSRNDLIALSLTSHKLRSAACTLLFKTINLKVNLKSFARLQKISCHPEFKRHVRTISYDGRRLFDLGSKAFEEDLEGWVRRHACTGLGLGSVSLEKILVSSFTTDQLKVYHHNFLEYVQGQRLIKTRDNEKVMLMEAIRRLPGLMGVVYYTKSRELHKTMSDFDLSKMSYVAQETLVEPYETAFVDECHFWSLFDAATSIKLANFSTLKGSDLGFDAWARGAVRYEDRFEILSTLETLELEFVFQRLAGKESCVLSRLLSNCSSLRSLRISFHTLMLDRLAILDSTSANDLITIIPKDSCWKYLRCLSLQAISTTQADLEELLLKHALTLRSLELRDIMFLPNSASSWISIFKFMRRRLKLRFVKFSSSLYNGRFENWRVPDDHKDDNLVFPKSCIRTQVEQRDVWVGMAEAEMAYGGIDLGRYGWKLDCGVLRSMMPDMSRSIILPLALPLALYTVVGPLRRRCLMDLAAPSHDS